MPQESERKVKGGLFSALQNSSSPDVRVGASCGMLMKQKYNSQAQHHYMSGGTMSNRAAPLNRCDEGMTDIGRTTPGRAAAGAEILHIINRGNEFEGSNYDFSCSPPTRASNPLCKDSAFGKFFTKMDRTNGSGQKKGRDLSTHGNGQQNGFNMSV